MTLKDFRFQLTPNLQIKYTKNNLNISKSKKSRYGGFIFSMIEMSKEKFRFTTMQIVVSFYLSKENFDFVDLLYKLIDMQV